MKHIGKVLRRVIVFGVFDRLHPGHRAFLGQAKRHGKEVIAVVARDSAVKQLKNRKPTQNEKIRMRNVRRVPGVFCAVLGDHKEGEYGVIKKYKPDVICLGYDQQALENDLKKCMRQKKILRIRLVRLRAFMPKKYHSSLL
ncbi:MAG: FAD synthase [Parcubacteria group bacterium GW2011_GWA2_45_30]|nr:MAG: FAD synthase [Parcubacteria group bacterium GW2011_GWA2_45_30]